jgi:hypothetical protein
MRGKRWRLWLRGARRIEVVVEENLFSLSRGKDRITRFGPAKSLEFLRSAPVRRQFLGSGCSTNYFVDSSSF